MKNVNKFERHLNLLQNRQFHRDVSSKHIFSFSFVYQKTRRALDDVDV